MSVLRSGVPLLSGAFRYVGGQPVRVAAQPMLALGALLCIVGGRSRMHKQVSFGACLAVYMTSTCMGHISGALVCTHTAPDKNNVVALDGLGSVRRIADLKHRFTAQWMHTSISSCQVARRPEESHARTSRDGTWTLSLDLSVA